MLHYDINTNVIYCSILYSLLVVALAKSIAKLLGVLDHPGAQQHKAHTTATPLVGGIACIPPTVMAMVWVAGRDSANKDLATAMAYLAACAGLSFVIGLLDDRKHIPALRRLFLCGIIFTASLYFSPTFVVSALSIDTLSLRVDLGWAAIPFTTLSLLAFQNAVNMADGRNGLTAGVAIIWLLALLSYGAHPTNLAIATLLVSLVVVLAANLRGWLFLGDAGTYGIGAFIGMATIWIHHSNIGLHTMDVVVIMLIPVLDMIRLFIGRLASGGHPFAADHDHLHHYLCRSVGWPRGLMIYYGLVALPIITMRLGLTPGLYGVLLGAAMYAATLYLTSSRSFVAARAAG